MGTATWIIIIMSVGILSGKPETPNLILQLIQDFEHIHNVSQITACLPLPQSASNPVTWGILTMGLNKTWKAMWKTQNRTSLTWHTEEGKYVLQWTPKENGTIDNCNITKPLLKFETSGETVEVIYCPSGETCTNTPWGMHIPRVWGAPQHGNWDYMQTTDWCIDRRGTIGLPDDPIHVDVLYANFNTSRSESPKHYNWNCTKVYNCSSREAELQRLGPIAQALRLGCICHNYTTPINDTWSHLTNKGAWSDIICSDLHIPSMGHTVWVSSDGTWTIDLLVGGQRHQHSLGLLTLCPLWREQPLTLTLWGQIQRESADPWQHPTTGTVVGWVLESIFTPGITAFQNRMLLYNLTGQTEALANATRIGLEDLNIQLQTTSEMALQNRLTLDLLLLYENEVCGYLNLANDTCCIHIPNVTKDLSEQLDHVKSVVKASRDLRESVEVEWLNKLLHELGFSLSGWLASLLQFVLEIIIMITMFCILLLCLRSMLTQVLIRQIRLVPRWTELELYPGKKKEKSNIRDTPKTDFM